MSPTRKRLHQKWDTGLLQNTHRLTIEVVPEVDDKCTVDYSHLDAGLRGPSPAHFPMNTKPLRIAAVGDIHYTKHSKGKCQELFASASAHADVLLLCGDLTDYSLPEEAALLAEDLKAHLKFRCSR